MADSFYRQFEARFRGQPQEIKKRLAVYLPLLAPLQGYYGEATLLDLGCGRGEWLELAGEAGWQATGVELDEGMADQAQALGLRVEVAEAHAYLRGQTDESLSAVTAFHLAEHLEFDRLRELIGECLRVLRPGGILILETPNPENLTVGSCSFYTDPTHRAPIPAGLLAFLAENSGFARVRTMGLNDLPVGEFAPGFSLVGLLYGVSPDYAVIAQKSATILALEEFPWPAGNQGHSLLEAASAFDRGLHERLAGLASQIEELRARQERMKPFYVRISSWLSRVLKSWVRGVLFYALARPGLAARLRPLLHRLPGLQARLKTICFAPQEDEAAEGSAYPVGEQKARLSPAAARIYQDLQAALAEHKRK